MTVYNYDDALKMSIDYFGGEDLPAKVFLDKYALRDNEGVLLEATPTQMHRRLSKEFARIESKYDNPMSEDEIFDLIDHFKYIIPQGSPMSAIGNPYHVQSSGNCFSIEPPHDSYGGICYTDQQLVQLMKRRCVEENSMVNIRDKGLISIKNVQIGDYILSFNNKNKISEYKKVIDIFTTQVDKEDRIQISFSNGSILKTSKKHPILTYVDNYTYKKGENLQEGDICIKPSQENKDYLLFDENLSNIAWFIGCHVGDGTVGRIKNGGLRLRNTGDNEAVIKKYAEMSNLLTGSKAQYKISTRKDYKTKCWEYTNNKKSLDGVVNKYFDGMVGQKVYTVKVSEFIKENNLWIPFISGLIDADGHIRDYGTIDIAVCSQSLIDEISSFLSACGISYHSSVRYPKRKNEKSIYRIQIHSNRKVIDIFAKYMTHNVKKEKIRNAICREFSHKKFLSTDEKQNIIKKYEEILYPTNRYSDTKLTVIERGARNNLSSIIGLLKKDKNVGIGALNSFLNFNLISQAKHDEILQRIFVKKIEKDIESKKYIDIEVEGNNNFYAGNFGMINIHNCGVGLNLSTLRPKGQLVKNAAKTTDGIEVFMNRFSNTCREVAQKGRRGAEILLLNAHHPEIETFINSKRDKTKITGANISIQATDDFLSAAMKNKDYEQRWPVDSDDPSISHITSAKKIWDSFIDSSWESAEPGILFWDTVLKYSVSNNYGTIDKTFYDTACNPCGEIVMGADSCRLLAINVLSFVENKFESNARFNYTKFSEVVQKAQRMMDDMVDLEIELIERILNKIESDPEPDYIKEIEKQTWIKILETCKKGRRTGLGITGLGDTIAALNQRYGSETSIRTTERIYKSLCLNAYHSTCILAKERGSFPIFSHEIEKDNLFLSRIWKADPELYKLYKKYGRRNIALTTTPPAGSISVLAQVSSGIEPVFMVEYKRRKKINSNDEGVKVDFIDESGDSWQEFDVYHKGFKEWMEITGKVGVEASPYFKATSKDVDWIASVDIQAAAQKWICHSISKTCNLPKDATKELVEKVYKRAWKKECKGFTIYRDGCRTGVLVGKKELEEKNNYIVKTDAPKRPKRLMCDIFHVSVKKIPFFIIVGTLNKDPYEIFAGVNVNSNGDIVIPKSFKEAVVEKEKRGKYSLIDIEDNQNIIGSISQFIDEEQEAVTRLISSNLRHGCDVNFIVHQLEKTKGDLMSFSKAISRVLKKYIKEGSMVHGESCPECKGELRRAEGCISCTCGFSKCG
jgi:ribonucleoside-diphosphate reductase alpha chain